MRIGPAFLQTFSSQVVQSLASIVTGIIIARGLGPSGQGQYAVFVAAVGLLSTVAAMGQFEGHVLASAGDRIRGRALLMRSLLQAAGIGLLAAVTQGLWRAVLGTAVSGLAVWLLCAILTGEVLALLFRGINLGQHNITAYNVAALAQRLAFLLVVGIASMRLGLSVTTVLGAWLAAVTINVALGATWIWNRSAPTEASGQSLVVGWTTSLRSGVRALLTITLTLLLVRADIYMLGPLVGVAAVGQISVASSFAEYLWYVPSILGSVLFASVAADRGPQTVRKVCQATRTIVAVLLPLAILLLLVGRQIIPWIYGSAYQQAGVLFLLLLPGMVAISIHLVLDSYFAGIGFPMISYAAAGGALVLKVVFNLLVVPKFGLAGAALATSVVYVLLLTTKVIAFRRRTGVSAKDVLRPTLADVRDAIVRTRSWVTGLRSARSALT